MPFIHEHPSWPAFHWEDAVIATPLATARYKHGRLIGRLQAFGFPLRDEASLATLTEDIVTTSAIEGEVLDVALVRSSVARRLGIDIGGLSPKDRAVDGLVEVALDAARGHARPLTDERLFAWHAALFPTGWSGLTRIRVGAWRDDREAPMRVVSGPRDRERVHFEAPAAPRLPAEMASFLAWFAQAAPRDPLLTAGLAHLRFLTIHPFEDGNGRIARSIADLALARGDGASDRFVSMSAEIRARRESYYEILEATQRGGLDVTAWLAWFIACFDAACDRAANTLATVVSKAQFLQRHGDALAGPRTRAVVLRLLDGFEGKLTTSRYAALAKCSPDTALRDIDALVRAGVLVRAPGGGRSTHYVLGGTP
jgi:Fic family protein